MNQSFISTLIDDKKSCYFISPHFDDAVFSAGLLMRYLSGKTKVIVINIFTKADKKPYTLSAKTFLRQCRYSDANTLFIDREKEDAAVLQNIADKVINLGYVDALWRKKQQQTFLSKLFSKIPEMHMLYPTYFFHIKTGKVAKQDEELIYTVGQRLNNIITSDNSVIFCPFAIGNHIDHVIARLACERAFTNVIYWSDFPYNLHTTPDTRNFVSFQFDENLNEKHRLVKGYVSQYNAMFGKGLYLHPEIFYWKNG